jgi:dipicolinate synthase subunit B
MLTVGFAVTGSFCTFHKAMEQLDKVVAAGYNVIPIMSQISYEADTRFGFARDFREHMKNVTGNEIVHTIVEAEPFGPKSKLDIMVIAPATGNTLAKLANGINDTAVTMAAKATLRNGKPILLAVSTNDALSTSGQNIGKLLNTKGIYFVPMRQDNIEKKPTSIVADFDYVLPALEAALEGRQIQPVFV